MENSFWAVLVGLALIVGISFGGLAFPHKVVEEVSVEKFVEVEVVKEVPVDREVEVVKLVTPLSKAVADFLKAAEDEEDEAGNDVEILSCADDEYEWDEISLRDVEEAYSVVHEDDEEYSVFFEVDLKYKQDDVSRCRQSFNVTVHYEDDEDTEVFASLIVPQ